jgi:DNA-binding transcriptional MerR regulator
LSSNPEECSEFLRIGDLSRRTGVPPHVLRYWETEFPQLKPRKGSGGQRLYRRSDVALVERIKDLLYNRRFTIAGARRSLRGESAAAVADVDALLREIAQIRALIEPLARR